MTHSVLLALLGLAVVMRATLLWRLVFDGRTTLSNFGSCSILCLFLRRMFNNVYLWLSRWTKLTFRDAIFNILRTNRWGYPLRATTPTSARILDGSFDPVRRRDRFVYLDACPASRLGRAPGPSNATASATVNTIV